jgi:hemolysin activation/secretion protein
VLPPLELPEGRDTEGLEGGARVYVDRIEISGNTALAEAELHEIARSYVDRELSFADLEALRDALTLAYVQHGFVTSGAVIPTQSLADGVLEVWVVEGTLEDIQVETDGRFRPGYIRNRIAPGAGPPVNVLELNKRLQRLQQDEGIRAIQAALVPGEQRGESVLQIRVAEARPWQIRLEGNNYNSPAIGEWRGQAIASYRNLNGWGDELTAEYEGGEGLNEFWVRYAVPLNAYDTTAEIHFWRTWSEVVEKPFDALDIKSETETYGFTLSQPAYRTLNTYSDVFLTGEWRRSESFLFSDHPWSFVPGPEDGVATLAVLRFGGNWSYRTRTQVIAARSMLTVGLDILGATQNSGDIPDGQFVAWLGQLQWARRLPFFDSQLIASGDVQIADRPLFGIEQFSIGGYATVRGYRENTLVRDNGLVGSIEWRVPVPLPSWREWRPRFELAPFVDAGYSWNADRPTRGPTTLVSVGIGGRLSITDQLHFEIYWGEALKDIEKLGENTLQDEGLHMGLTWRW